MFGQTPSENWEKYGAEDPYYGVLSHDIYHKKTLDSNVKHSFFESGVEYINDVVKKIKQHIDADFSPDNSLDFGCGVGRLLIPISTISKESLGVDVSASMLKEATVNLEYFSVNNVKLIESTDCAILRPKTFDFVHSYIVFQHIPVKNGMLIFNNIMSSLKSGGVGVLHFTYSNPGLHSAKGLVKRCFPFLRLMIKALKREKIQPEMQMNEYELNKIYELLNRHGVGEVYSEITDHDGIKGVCLYFNKKK